MKIRAKIKDWYNKSIVNIVAAIIGLHIGGVIGSFAYFKYWCA